MAKYYLTKKAVEDLSEIWDYRIEISSLKCKLLSSTHISFQVEFLHNPTKQL
jgi:hypothetical protein